MKVNYFIFGMKIVNFYERGQLKLETIIHQFLNCLNSIPHLVVVVSELEDEGDGLSRGDPHFHVSAGKQRRELADGRGSDPEGHF